MAVGKQEEGAEGVVKIKHFSHPHLLVLNEGGDKSKEAQCQACLESLLFGPSFSCEQHCEFHLHKLCAQAPLEISHSPFHREHRRRRNRTLTLAKTSLVHHSNLSFSCDLCHENRDMFFYHCSSSACHFSLDIKCALLLHHIDENFHEIKYVAHEHPLTLIENNLKINDIELQTMDCQWCCKPMVESAYVCLNNCRFGLHKNCARLPAHINHPCHRKHPLFLRHKSTKCQLCQLGQGESLGLFYSCRPCNFNIHIKCVALGPRSIVEDKISHHDHPFTLSLRHKSFNCDACGTEGNYVSYICCICHIMIHKNCISLPRFIKSTRHRHIVTHNYFFQKKFPEKHDCGICLSEVKVRYGCYSCLKRNCNYVAHVNCAMEMYEKIDQVPEMYEDIDEDEEEESSADLASIVRVLEWNERGEAIEIRHFSHDHDLKLNDKIKINEEEDDEDKQCDGCMLSISTSFYYCSQCEFLLHKTCAELPRKRHHWFHPSLTILSKADIFKCDQCNRLCSGLVYKSIDKNSAAKAKQFCLRCTATPHTLTCQGPRQHKHSLFFDLKFKERCDACDARCENGAFKCKDCSLFALDFACITLPEVAWHKSDEHPLKLTFHDENDDPEQRCCDICEERRNKDHCCYSCTICDNSAHPRCILGKHPFLKSGSTWPDSTELHDHKLIFTRKIDDYAKCSRCFKHFQDEALKCEMSTCNFIIHCERCEPSNDEPSSCNIL